MSWIDMMTTLHVTFTEGQKGLGTYRYRDEQMLFEIMKRAHAQVEDHQIVEHALAQRRPGSVVLRLSDEQYAALTASLKKRASWNGAGKVGSG